MLICFYLYMQAFESVWETIGKRHISSYCSSLPTVDARLSDALILDFFLHCDVLGTGVVLASVMFDILRASLVV